MFYKIQPLLISLWTDKAEHNSADYQSYVYYRALRGKQCLLILIMDIKIITWNSAVIFKATVKEKMYIPNQ